MTSNSMVTWKKIVVTHCLAIDCPDAGTGSPGSLESTNRRTSPALRSTTAWSQSSSSGPSMRFRWPRTLGQAWASSVSLSLSTHCREVRPCFSVTLSGFFFLLPNSCCFYLPLCFHLFLFISGGRKHAGLNRLMLYLFTCPAEVNTEPPRRRHICFRALFSDS